MFQQLAYEAVTGEMHQAEPAEQLGLLTKKQLELYRLLGVEPPA